ncbi:MAG: hypothetical protein KA715_02315 [Xanthomonadaceae bacterium]|nr:hypothetical protein [Xanthomonadaceae bacterium]
MSQSKKQMDLTQGTGATTADVLYQRIGGKWYAFSVVGDEVYMSPISEDLIDEARLMESASPNDKQKVA